ncbi:MAG: cytidine deaminase [Bacillota bacterium]|nr:cytidine deaminase [Bacillota bacterium]NLL26686.1 cytidine deaminase [Erysipelotrichia bacterium]
MNQKRLIELAFKAADNAYCQYSNYKVGACCLCKDGKYFLGANIENASYGATICAERNAVFSAYSNGYKKDDIEALCIVTFAKKVGSPCGICRQVLCELLHQDTPIILANENEVIITDIAELLPMQFTEEDLK